MIRYAIAGLLLGCAGVPLVLWYPPIHNAVIAVGHQGQTYPVTTLPVAVVVVPVAPQREIRTFAWFVAHPATIEPARVQCQRGSDAIPAECQNADRASLHMFNTALREKYFGKGSAKQ
jgi:hypothetical protein